LPARAFALQSQRKYPLYRRVAGRLVPSASHARTALARAAQWSDRLTAREYATITRRATAVLAQCGEGSTMATKKKATKKKATKKKAAKRKATPKKKATKKKAAKRKATKKKATKKKATKKKATKKAAKKATKKATKKKAAGHSSLNAELLSRKLSTKPAEEMAGRKDIYYGRDRVASNMRASDTSEWLRNASVKARFPVSGTVAQELRKVNADALPRMVKSYDRKLAAAAKKEIARRAKGGKQTSRRKAAPDGAKKSDGNGGASSSSAVTAARERAIRNWLK